MKNNTRNSFWGIGYSFLTHIAVLGSFIFFYKVLRYDWVSGFSTLILMCASAVAYFYLQYRNTKPVRFLVSASIAHTLLYRIECGLWSLIDQANAWHIWDPIGTIFFKGLSYSMVILILLIGLFTVFVIDSIRIGVIHYLSYKSKV